MLDGQVVRREAEVADVLERFVCVRAVEINSLDLAAFQFDPGLTWAILFMNADKTVYGRYGTRSNAEGWTDVSLKGFRKAALAALEIHQGYPGNKASLAGKAGGAPRFPTPRGYPSLKGYPATVNPDAGERNNPTCIHCHQVQAAEYRAFRDAKEPIPDRVLWAYPMPNALGLELDPEERATVRSVTAGSAAEKAGFKSKDELVRLDGQPLVSIADVQWVLEHAADGASLKADVRRGDASLSFALPLPQGFRRKGDFSWRTATWETFRPDLNAEALAPGERRARGLDDAAVAIRIKYAGPGLGGGFQKDDVIVEIDGRRTGLSTFSDLLAHVAQKKTRGEKMAVTILREGKELQRQITVP